MLRGSDSHAMLAMAGLKGTGHSQTGLNVMVGLVLRLVMGVMSVKNMYVISGLGLLTCGGMLSARVQDVHGYLRLRHDQWGLSTESGHWHTQCAAWEGHPLQWTWLHDKGGGWDQNLCGRVWHEHHPIPATPSIQSLHYQKASPGSTQDLGYIRASRLLVWYVAQTL